MSKTNEVVSILVGLGHVGEKINEQTRSDNKVGNTECNPLGLTAM